MVEVLSIGLGGVGVIAAHALETSNENVHVTAVIRSDFDKVISEGYTIKQMAVGESAQREPSLEGYTPTHVVKSLEDAVALGPFDYIVVSTKAIPQTSNNVWDQVYELREKLIKTEDITSIVLIQNGLDIEKQWSKLGKSVNMISGVSYISSINTKGTINMWAPDAVTFGLFDPAAGNHSKLSQFIQLYTHSINSVEEDKNVRFTRMRKLLYNASFNTICCLTNSDVAVVFATDGVIDNIVRPLMKEIQLVANQDLKLHGSEQLLEDSHVEGMIKFTEETDVPFNYEPSMLVDLRNKRQIELQVILANLIQVYKQNNPEVDVKVSIPYINFLYYSLKVVQHKLAHGIA
ncbi:hypothetical protein PSN45_004608 [Yamadazyma tenuis]|uniref:6-phosphogluconate dehydrogenase C-terminal domain-like protein n=1 Tax=Candida tenuis (strain ATCC 10573 / BCRC 21748 / CBS 615 / JCM 9827 / NBRC 10315 / NRRL Y-1498 / VKM Y-70) TaxID=590646 RepID=G3B529_CANTC|nr:uncharacterized protein CANTEDRAFT_114438 [Yamadazyma tenuis ATCC 10573]EGV63122.1 hypothetical protein CANTEDRAFT_114438 [Yamadazyma tenuis ATCC 10573]WEJ97061.1 hypothetical protein PSN45_004608 [Yamadazyma tenuis]